MNSESIQIPLRRDDATRLAQIGPEQREALVRTLAAVTHAYLQPKRTMDDILADSVSRAKAAGLTEKTLEDLLRD